MTLKNDLFGEVGPSAVTCPAALEVNGLLWVLGLNETQQRASVRRTEDLVDVMRDGQASNLLGKVPPAVFGLHKKSWSYAQEV